MMQSPQTPPVRTVSPLARYHYAERCALQHEPVQPLPGFQEIRIVLGVAVSVWLFLALFSFNHADVSFFNRVFPVGAITNWCGWLGAQLASWLFVLCGPGAWALWAIASTLVLPKSDRRFIHHLVHTLAGSVIVASVSLFGALISFSPVGGGIIGNTLFSAASVIGVVGCGLLCAATLFFSSLIFARLSLRQFLMMVAKVLVFIAASFITIWQLLRTGFLFLLPREPRKQEDSSQNKNSLTIEISETLGDDMIYDMPETEVLTGSAHSSIRKTGDEKELPASIKIEEIAEASAYGMEEAEEELTNEIEEIIEQAANQPAKASPDEEQSFTAQESSNEEEDDDDNDDENEEDEDDESDDDDDGNSSSSGGGGSRPPHIYHGAAREEAEDEESGPAVYTEPASFMLPPLTEIFDTRSTSNQDSVFLARCEERARILEEKLRHFGIDGHVINFEPGPVITLFEYEPEAGNKVSRILALEDDLALSLKALSIRILAPIPGKSVVGFEIANEKRDFVAFGDIIGADGLSQSRAHLPLALGVDTTGNPVVADLATMPHLLVAGATGAGKSVGMNVMLVSLLAKVTPDKVRIILIDPKRLEFTPYADIPHLLFPIITNPADVAPVLKWVAQEMELRYELMAQIGVRNITEYHKLDPASCFAKEREIGIHVHGMPYMVIMIDELADLIMVGGREIETLIARIAQMARAAGIHMLVATQRPSVDVVTGLIKANFPSRIAFRVSTKIDSRTIIDSGGAEKLLGKGDMLYMSPSHMGGLQRLHGAYVTDAEIDRLTDYLKGQRSASYFSLKKVVAEHTDNDDDMGDPLYDDVREFIMSVEEISISLLQRKYRVGFNRSARLIEMLERDGYVAAAQGGKPRRVLRG